MSASFPRPIWWDDDCEVILRFVRRHRWSRGITPGTPVPMLWGESDCGFYVLGVLAYTPNFEGMWNDLADPVVRRWALRRVQFEEQKIAA